MVRNSLATSDDEVTDYIRDLSANPADFAILDDGLLANKYCEVDCHPD